MLQKYQLKLLRLVIHVGEKLEFPTKNLNHDNKGNTVLIVNYKFILRFMLSREEHIWDSQIKL